MSSKVREVEHRGNSYLSDKKQSTSKKPATAVASEMSSSMTEASSTLSENEIINAASSTESSTLPQLIPKEMLTPVVSSLAATTVFENQSTTGRYNTSTTTTASDDLCLQELIRTRPETKISSTTMIAIKFLVSNNMAGSIIGRSGKTISDLQVQSSSRIKLSQSGACYPGTADRVCLIQGQIESVKKALSLILQQLHDVYHQQVAQQQSSSHEASLFNKEIGHHHQEAVVEREDGFDLLHGNEPSRIRQHLSHNFSPPNATSETLFGQLSPQKSQSFVVRLLIPTACSGMIIGRGGCNVKSIAESSGVASIRLAPKEGEDGQQSMVQSLQQQQATSSLVLVPPMQGTSERIVTITGQDLSCCVKCCHLILENLALQPELSRYTNMTTNYTTPTTPANAAFVTSSPNSNAIESISSLVFNASLTSPLTNKSSLPISQRQHQSLQPITGQQFPPSNTIRFPSAQPLPNVGVAGLLSHHHPATMLQYSGSTSFAHIDANPSPSNASSILPTSQIPMNTLTPEQGSFNSSHHQQPPMPHPLYLVTSTSSPGSMFVHAAPRSISNNSTAHANRENTNPTLNATGIHSEQNLSSSILAEQGNHHNMTQQFGSHSPATPNRNRAEPLLHSNPPSSQKACIKTDKSLQENQQFSTRQITVPDCLIGAILGRKGQTLTELQLTTNTKIKISQRGVFVPGTSDRIVTISGPSPINVSNAQYFISQRLAQAASRIRITSTSTDYSAKQRNSTPSSPPPNIKDIQNTLNKASSVVNDKDAAFENQKHLPSTLEDGLKPTQFHDLNTND